MESVLQLARIRSTQLRERERERVLERIGFWVKSRVKLMYIGSIGTTHPTIFFFK